jgi:hypothetical protein
VQINIKKMRLVSATLSLASATWSLFPPAFPHPGCREG